MPKFRVVQFRDAFILYEAIVEAPNAQAARDLCEADQCEWDQADVVEFDEREIPLEEIEEIENDEAK